MAKRQLSKETGLRDEQLFLFESLMQKCIEFMHLFELPADKEMLLSLVKLIYYSYALPDDIEPDDMSRILKLSLKKKYLTIRDGLFEMIPFPLEEVNTLQGTLQEIEQLNHNFYPINHTENLKKYRSTIESIAKELTNVAMANY